MASFRIKCKPNYGDTHKLFLLISLWNVNRNYCALWVILLCFTPFHSFRLSETVQSISHPEGVTVLHVLVVSLIQYFWFNEQITSSVCPQALWKSANHPFIQNRCLKQRKIKYLQASGPRGSGLEMTALKQAEIDDWLVSHRKHFFELISSIVRVFASLIWWQSPETNLGWQIYLSIQCFRPNNGSEVLKKRSWILGDNS